MPAPTLDFKIAFLEGLLSQFAERPIEYWIWGVERRKIGRHSALASVVTYAGVEPDSKSRFVANELLHVCREGACRLGEAMNAGESFDLTVSLSVLEHVKISTHSCARA